MTTRYPYDASNPTTKAWSSSVYRAAKEFVPEFLEDSQGRSDFATIKRGFRTRHPQLCDDSIADPSNPSSPYWGHLIASAIQALKKASTVAKGRVRGEWILKTATPSTSEKQQRPPTAGEGNAVTTSDENHTEHGDEIQARLHERLLGLDSSQFERLVGEFLSARGLTDVLVTQRSHDGGIDGHASLPFLGISVAFQAKRYRSQSVGVEPVAAFKGRIDRYDRGVFITTSTFTAGARELVEQSDKVLLLDGSDFCGQMIELGLGVKEVPVVDTRLDEDFFAKFTD